MSEPEAKATGKPWYKRWWLIALIAFGVIIVFGALVRQGKEPIKKVVDKVAVIQQEKPKSLRLEQFLFASGDFSEGDLYFTVYNPNKTLGLHRSNYRVSLKDANGKLLSVSTEGMPGSLLNTIYLLPPGQRIVLHTTFPVDQAPAADTTISFSAPSTWQSFKPVDVPPVEVTNAQLQLNETGTLIGEVKNPGDSPRNFYISIAIFDENNRLVNAGADVVDDVPPGQLEPFQIFLANNRNGRLEIVAYPTKVSGLKDFTFSNPKTLND